MADAYTHHEKLQFAIKSAKPKIHDYDDEPLEVEKFYIVPVSDDIERVSYNTDVVTEEERLVDGIPTEGEKKRRATLAELPEKLKELARIAEEHDKLKIQASFTEWDRSKDEEQDQEGSVFFMRESDLEDLKVVDERAVENQEENQEEDDEEKEEIL